MRSEFYQWFQLSIYMYHWWNWMAMIPVVQISTEQFWHTHAIDLPVLPFGIQWERLQYWLQFYKHVKDQTLFCCPNYATTTFSSYIALSSHSWRDNRFPIFQKCYSKDNSVKNKNKSYLFKYKTKSSVTFWFLDSWCIYHKYLYIFICLFIYLLI